MMNLKRGTFKVSNLADGLVPFFLLHINLGRPAKKPGSIRAIMIKIIIASPTIFFFNYTYRI